MRPFLDCGRQTIQNAEKKYGHKGERTFQTIIGNNKSIIGWKCDWAKYIFLIEVRIYKGNWKYSLDGYTLFSVEVVQFFDDVYHSSHSINKVDFFMGRKTFYDNLLFDYFGRFPSQIHIITTCIFVHIIRTRT